MPGRAFAEVPIACQAMKSTIAMPTAALTEYRLPKNPSDAEENVDGPTAVAVAPDGRVWFALHLSKGVGTVRDGKVLLCRPPLNNVPAMTLLGRVTKTTPAALPQTLHVSLPPGGNVYAKALAPYGSTWFTIDYSGMHGNPTNAGVLGHLGRSHRPVVYKIVGVNDNTVAIAVAKNGIVWLGDYYNEKIIRVDPSKLHG